MKIICHILGHNWKNQELTIIKNNTCEYSQQCKRCGKINLKKIEIFHNYSNGIYTENGSCKQQRKCIRCHDITTAILHNWKEEGIFVANGSCVKEYECKRCSETKRALTHEWSEWSPCHINNKTRQCKRCNLKEYEKEICSVCLGNGYTYGSNSGTGTDDCYKCGGKGYE